MEAKRYWNATVHAHAWHAVYGFWARDRKQAWERAYFYAMEDMADGMAVSAVAIEEITSIKEMANAA